MEAQDIAIYGALAYLIYRLTRPAEAPPVTEGSEGPAYVPVPSPEPLAKPADLSVIYDPAAPPRQTLYEPTPYYSLEAQELKKAAAIIAATPPVASPTVTELLAAPPGPQQEALAAQISYAWEQNAPSVYSAPDGTPLSIAQVLALREAGIQPVPMSMV